MGQLEPAISGTPRQCGGCGGGCGSGSTGRGVGEDAELHVHCCDVCTAQKGPSRRSHAPLQQYLIGAPMERIGVDILGPFPITEAGNRFSPGRYGLLYEVARGICGAGLECFHDGAATSR